MEKNNLIGGDRKVQEYIDRIKEGESKDSIMQGLPPSFASAIDKALESQALEPEKLDEERGKNKVLDNLKCKEELEIEKQNQANLDSQKIEEIRRELQLNCADNKKDNNLEKYDISLPNLDEIIKKGGGQLEIFSNGKKVDFEEFVLVVDDSGAEVMFIRKKDPTQNKGIGIPIYIELGKKLAEKGIVLNSSKAQYGPGRDLWLKLSQLGFTKKANGGFVFQNKESLRGGEVSEGSLVKYQGEKWRVKEIIKHKYDLNGKTEEKTVYNLERSDGYILQDGGVKKFVFREDFEVLDADKD